MQGVKPLLAALCFGLLAAEGAHAAPCAGFTDVDTVTDAAFCPSVQWIRNRGVTLGCTSTTLYCPANNVSRLQMAAFMNRLGAALTALPILAQTSPGAQDLDLNPVVCQTTDYAVNSFPRRAALDLSFASQASGDVDLTANLMASVDGGTSWSPVNSGATPGSVSANQWGNVSIVGTRDLDVGQTVRFGVRLARLTGTADLSDSRCNLRAMINSRDGTVPPF